MPRSRKKRMLTYKIVIMGDKYVGKSSLLNRFVNDRYNPHYSHTAGGEMYQTSVSVDDKNVNLLLLDTAGQEDQKSLIKSLYRDAHGIMVVFDVANMKSFDDVDDWIRLIEMNTVCNPAVLMVGNKTDLTDRKKFPPSDRLRKAKSRSISYYDVSAKIGLNVNEAFESLVREVIASKGISNDMTDTIRLDKDEQPKSEGCCFS